MINYLINNYSRVYFLSLLLGILIIIISQIFNSIYASIIISLWMAFLGYLIFKKSYINYEESDADYFYYLGFIYTIFTLATSFMLITFSPDGGAFDTKIIIKSFGLGLITTFIGLSGRVLLYQQFERQTTGAEEAVQRISIIGDRFARQLSSLTGSMKVSLEEITGAYNESALSLNRATVGLASEIAALTTEMQELRKKTNKSISQLEKVSESYSAVVNEKLSGLSIVIDGFNSSVSRANIATSLFVDNFDFTKNFDQFARKIDDVELSINNFSSAIGSASSQIGGLSNEVSNSFSVSTELQSQLNENLKFIFDSTEKQKDLINKFITLLKGDVDTYAMHTNSMVDLSESAVKVSDSLKTLNSRMESVVQSISSFNLLPSIHTDLLTSQKLFVDNLNSMASASGNLSNELSMSIQSIVEQLKTGSLEYLEASSNQQKFINNLQHSQAAVAETHSALIATIKALRSEFQ